ncbi:hypothetical protein Tco_0836012 [Tanacetum coccineum]
MSSRTLPATRHSPFLLKSLKSSCSSFVQGVDFTEVPDDETTLTFLIDLGYKVLLYKHPIMYVDYMHQPWRTLAAVINKCLSGKVASNDRLRKSRIDILWGMFYRENVDYPELIWEDLALQIDHRQLKKGKRENMPYPRFTKIIINHFLSKHQSLTKLQYLHTHTIKDDGAVSKLKFVRIDLLPPKKSSDDNIIPEPDVALELGKSMSLTKAAKEEAARQVHATHERIMTKSPEPARKRPSEQLDAYTMEALKASRRTGTEPGVLDEEKVTSKAKSNVILDWGSEQKSEYSEEGDDDENIEWVDTDEEEEKNDDYDDKSINLEKTGDEETGDEFVHSEENAQDDDELVHVDEQVNDDEDEEMTNAKDADTRNGDEEITNTAKVDVEKTEVVKNDIKKAKLPPTSSSLSVSSGFGNQFLNLSSDTSLIGIVKDTTDAEINSLLDVQIQQEIPQIQSPSILIVPMSMISVPSVLPPIPETTSVVLAITLLPPLTVSSILHVQLQTTTPIPSLLITTEAPLVTTIPHPLPAIIQRVSILKKDVQELKEVDNTTTLCASLRSKILSVVNAYLRSNLRDALQKAVSDFATPVIQSTVKNALEKTPLLLAQSSSQAQSSLKAAESLSEYELKMILFDKMDKSRSYLTHDKHQVLYDALLNSMILDDAIARGQANPEKVMRKKDHDDEDPLAGPNQGKKTKRSRTKESEPSKKSSTSKESSKGKSPAKTSKSRKSVTAEEQVEELVFEMASDDIEQTADDVANDADQPLDDSTKTKDKDPKKDWFKQPSRPPTPDQEWNKRQVVVDQPEQPWFNNMVSAAKDPLTFDELMATPIDFSKYSMNRLKIDNLTQAHLVGPVYELLKGTCTSNIELEYNMEECFKALTDKLDWNNPEGDRCPFDLTKSLPLKGHCHTP